MKMTIELNDEQGDRKVMKSLLGAMQVGHEVNLDPDQQKNVLKAIKSMSAPNKIMSAPTKKTTYKRHSRKIWGGSAMMDKQNRITYKKYLGMAGGKFVKANPQVAKEDLANLILSRLPVQSKQVRKRVAIMIDIARS